MKRYRKSLKGGYNYRIVSGKRNNKKRIRSVDKTSGRSKARGYNNFKFTRKYFKNTLKTKTKTKIKNKNYN